MIRPLSRTGAFTQYEKWSPEVSCSQSMAWVQFAIQIDDNNDDLPSYTSPSPLSLTANEGPTPHEGWALLRGGQTPFSLEYQIQPSPYPIWYSSNWNAGRSFSSGAGQGRKSAGRINCCWHICSALWCISFHRFFCEQDSHNLYTKLNEYIFLLFLPLMHNL